MQKNYAFITGAADRIGKGIALDLAKKSYHLLLHYRSSIDKIMLVKEEAEKFGVKVELIQFDFMAENDFDKMFASFKERNINIDILVNSASEFRPSNFEEAGSAMLNRQLKINFESVYLLTKAFARTYDKGVIVNFLDTKVEKNYTKHLDYLLSKKLLKSFTQLAAVELAPHFRVNAIAPGLILPPADKDENYLLDLSKNIPLQTIGNLEEILKAFRFIIDSYFITGQILYIDGGDHLI